jgi:DNA-directed RNA polymerase subunit E'/Rpb7
MFERRELTRVVTVHSRHLQRNIQSSLLGQIKASVEGRCGTEGYVQPKSSVIMTYSLGLMSIIGTGVSYKVKFQADICLPHKGQRLEVPAEFRSKIGLHSEMKPLKILLPRDLHIGNADFEAVSDGDQMEIEVMGAEFKQNDEDIFVLAKLVRRITAAPAAPDEAAAEAAPEAPPPSAGAGEVKSVSISEAPPAASGPVRRKKRLQTGLEMGSTLELNVDKPIEAGSATGSAAAAGPE